ncbi:MAG TPA: hypothetical protein VFF63_05580 [Candidatus Babeliales bacterium]|nr:hypothetical protein [Candidatus Babeliales bacterium]
MSNISELLNTVAEANNGAITLAGEVIGSLADIGGAVNLVVSAIDLFLNDDQEILTQLNNIQTQIQNGFAAMAAEERAANILNRLNNLDPALAQAQSVIDNLKADLAQSPPVDEEYKLQQIELCLDSVEQFNQDDKWLTNYADEIYYGSLYDANPSSYTDCWTGIVAPTPNADGTVFSCRYVLPDFLHVLYDFMLVAAAFEPNYAELYQAQLENYSQRLQTAYNTSKQGLVTTQQPTPTQLGIFSFADNVPWWQNYNTSAMWGPDEPPGPGQFPYLDSFPDAGGFDPPSVNPQWHSIYNPVTAVLDWHGSVEQGPVPGHCNAVESFLDPTYGYWQEYGVVHTYTGYSNISNFPPIPLPSEKPNVFWPQFQASLSLALRRNYKQAYSDIGLASVWQTINVLNGLAGQPLLGTYDPDVVWTLRELGGILGSAFPPTPASGVSAQAVIAGLTTITTNMHAGVSGVAPAPPLTRPLSLRDALYFALHAVTFRCRPGGLPPISSGPYG